MGNIKDLCVGSRAAKNVKYTKVKGRLEDVAADAANHLSEGIQVMGIVDRWSIPGPVRLDQALLDRTVVDPPKISPLALHWAGSHSLVINRPTNTYQELIVHHHHRRHYTFVT